MLSGSLNGRAKRYEGLNLRFDDDIHLVLLDFLIML